MRPPPSHNDYYEVPLRSTTRQFTRGAYTPYVVNSRQPMRSTPMRSTPMQSRPMQSTPSSYRSHNRYESSTLTHPSSSEPPTSYSMKNRSATHSTTVSHNSSSRYQGSSSRDGSLLTSSRHSGSDTSSSSQNYYSGDIGLFADELLSPGPPDKMHSLEKLSPRKGASRYISEPDRPFTLFTKRGWANLSSMFILTVGLVMLFAGWPVIAYFRQNSFSDLFDRIARRDRNFKTAPKIPGFRGLIDPDTPRQAMTRRGFDGDEYELVFSDEFNQDGRTFWPGDDPYWEAADIHYWPTGDQEWYDPDGAVTRDGFLAITLSQMDPDLNHDLNYRSAMLTSWNKFCFTGGYFEVSLILPGTNEVGGFWPAVWTMGNLARAGFGGSTEGLWPYSYNSCDVGAMPNQTDPKTGAPGPSILTSQGDLSWQPGQRLGRCTCKGEDHPGPKNSDGSYKGRASPEIDILEAYSYERTRTGFASQSLQLAPYDAGRRWTTNLGETYNIYPNSGTKTTLNTYFGGKRQQTASSLSTIPISNYELGGNQTLSYGTEWVPDEKNPHITWSMGGRPTWTINGTALQPNAQSMVGQRLVSNEPMYMILNLGISDTFVPVNKARLNFPAKFLIDYVRIYQPKGKRNVGCNPKEYPTEDYINKHINAYLNVNITTWAQAGNTFPKNSMMDGCAQPS